MVLSRGVHLRTRLPRPKPSQTLAKLVAFISLLRLLLSLSEFRLRWERLRSGETKRRVLDAIERAMLSLPERVALKIPGALPRSLAWLEAASTTDRKSVPDYS